MARGRLQAELKKRHAFESAEQEALLNLLRTSDRFQTSMTRLFRKYGLTPSQYNVLRILRGEGKPLPCLEIANRLIAEVPGITGLLDRLEAAGLIRRERSTEDRRVVFAEIRPQGLELLGRLDRPLEDQHKRLIGHLTRAELTELSRLLEKARESLAAGD
ncbi:MAG: MarR family winged helix-turn-helix transcriptional regulator [Isosphaeraceae bacterium]